MMKRRFYLSPFLVLLVVVFTIGCSNPKRDYKKAEKLNTIEAYEEFLQKHASSEFADRARRKIEELHWQKAISLNTVEAYEQFLTEYPQGRFSKEAKEKIENIYWQQATKIGTRKVYEEFLQKYPEGKFAKEAKRKIEELDWKDAEKVNTIEAYEHFLQTHPDGQFVKRAKLRIDVLKIIVKRVPSFYIYEGSEIFILFPSGEIITLTYHGGKWKLLEKLSESAMEKVREKVKSGKFSILGKAKPGSIIR